MSCFSALDRMCQRIVSPRKFPLDQGQIIERQLRGFNGSHSHFQLTNVRGLKVSCVFFINDVQQKPTVLYLHGNGGSKMEMLPIVRADFGRNYNFCALDFCGCGLSEGDTISYGVNEVDDIEVVVKHLRQRFGVGDIHLWGRSMGAVAAILYSQTAQIPVSSMVLDSPFPDLQRVISNVARKEGIPWLVVFLGMFFVKSRVNQTLGFDVFEVNYSQVLSSYRDIPILFGFNKNDSVVLPKDVREMYECYSGQKQIFQIDSNHSDQRPREFTFQGLKFVFVKSRFNRHL